MLDECPGRPEVATGLPLIGTGFTLQDIGVVKSVTLLLHLFNLFTAEHVNTYRLSLFTLHVRSQHLLTLHYIGVSWSVSTPYTLNTLSVHFLCDCNSYLRVRIGMNGDEYYPRSIHSSDIGWMVEKLIPIHPHSQFIQHPLSICTFAASSEKNWIFVVFLFPVDRLQMKSFYHWSQYNRIC